MDDVTTAVTSEWMEEAPEFGTRAFNYGRLPVIMPDDREPPRSISRVVAAVLTVAVLGAIALLTVVR